MTTTMPTTTIVMVHQSIAVLQVSFVVVVVQVVQIQILEVGGMRMAHLARALPATLALVVQTVLPALQAIVDHLLIIALLILV